MFLNRQTNLGGIQALLKNKFTSLDLLMVLAKLLKKVQFQSGD